MEIEVVVSFYLIEFLLGPHMVHSRFVRQDSQVVPADIISNQFIFLVAQTRIGVLTATGDDKTDSGQQKKDSSFHLFQFYIYNYILVRRYLSGAGDAICRIPRNQHSGLATSVQFANVRLHSLRQLAFANAVGAFFI